MIKNSKLISQFAFVLAILYANSFAQDVSTGDLLGCTTTINGFYYNLEDLKFTTPEGESTPDQSYQVAYNNGNGNVTIDYNICGYSSITCPDERIDMANLVNENNTCYHVANPDAIITDVTTQLINENDANLGVTLMFPTGDKCSDTSNYMIEVQVNCNEDLTTASYHLDSGSLSNPCFPKVIMSSPAGCPVVSTGPLTEYLETYWYLVAFPMIGLGAFLMVAGGRTPQVAIFFIVTTTVSTAISIFLWLYLLPESSPIWVCWITSIVSMFLGAGLGFGAAYWPRLGIFIIGCAIGGLIGALIYFSVTSTNEDANEALVFSMAVLASGLLLALICLIFYDFAVIIGSALWGSYLFLRGISLIAGGWPNEIQVIMNAQNGTYGTETMSTGYFVYLFFVCLLFLVSMIAQIKHRSAHNDLYSYKGRFTDLDYKALRAKLSQGSKYNRENEGQNDDEQPLMEDE